jgi:dephospho-CoA kinase
MTFVVGLTGGIGSGKSAVAQEFARLGVTVVDTDLIAHELTGRGGAAIAGIRRLFGDASIDAQGAMDRAWVRARVFAEPAERRRLEALLHPMIREESERRLAAASGPYAVLMVPLLVESGNYRNRVQRVLVVDCAEDIQIRRVIARSAMTEDEVRRVIATQVSRAERVAAADDKIDNSGSIDALHERVRALHREYLALARRS